MARPTKEEQERRRLAAETEAASRGEQEAAASREAGLDPETGLPIEQVEAAAEAVESGAVQIGTERIQLAEGEPAQDPRLGTLTPKWVAWKKQRGGE